MNVLDLAYLPLAAVAAPVWARKSRADWPQRFGRTASLPAPAPGRRRLLIHAVSVGEVNTLRALVPMLTPHADVVVSVGTDTGIARARALFADAANPTDPAYLGPERVVRYPLDLSWAVKRFLDAVRPDAVVLVELELWPNFVRECERRSVPVSIINGRLSARSFKGYARARAFFRPLFSRLAFAAVQDEDYARRFEFMGVPAERLRVTGSMKWDSVRVAERAAEDHRATVPGALELARSLGIDLSRPLIVAGSTGPLDKIQGKDRGEEALLHELCSRLAERFPGLQLLCAPRKPERFEEAFAALGGPARCARRSLTKESLEDPLPEGGGRGWVHAERPADEVLPSSLSSSKPRCDRFLLDTIGELRAAYSLASIAIVGRSFGALHGSDPIEPIALGVPTIIGPAYGDFASIVETFRRDDALDIASVDELPRVIERLLNDPAERTRLADRGVSCIRAQQGATARHAQMLLELLSTTPQAR